MKEHWKNYYKLPLRYDVHSHYAFTADNVMALTFGAIDSASAEKIVSIINGFIESSIHGLTLEDGVFRLDGDTLMMVRGWGHLTGTGARNLDGDKAAEIQDEFAEYIFNRLKTK